MVKVKLCALHLISINFLLGLNVGKDKIMEMACLITDSDLNLIAEVQSSTI